MACKSSKKEFIWSDDEAELLLNVVHQYKVRKILEKVDWETVKSKYDDILELFKEELPDTEEEAKVLSKSYHLLGRD